MPRPAAAQFATLFAVLVALLIPSPRPAAAAEPAPVALRVATFNIEDLRTEELLPPYSERARRAAAVIQRIRPNVILINEIAYDMPGAPGFDADAGPGRNAARFAELLAVPQSPDLKPLNLTPFTAESNTGRASGFDLDRNGQVVTVIPPPAPEQTDDHRAFGGDCWGFGTFPGQYGMALLVDSRLAIKTEYVRTFRLFPWSGMPNALLPTFTDDEGNEKPWYEDEAGALFRLSSKSHWDVPVELPNGETVHFLCSHPTPPAFDGDEARNKKRNHDEIRFWADYVDNAAYFTDDRQQPGGLPRGAHFVVLGDLNADPDEGSALGDPIALLLGSRLFADDARPTSDIELPGLDPDDTARFRLRVDYVLPSRTITVNRAGVWRHPPAGGGEFPSDHFPVWADIVVPAE